MATCKECLHYEACSTFSRIINVARLVETGCEHFKDHTKWVEQKSIKTNADRIRAMSDEELADWLEETQYDSMEHHSLWWLHWLQQPAEEVPENG